MADRAPVNWKIGVEAGAGVSRIGPGKTAHSCKTSSLINH